MHRFLIFNYKRAESPLFPLVPASRTIDDAKKAFENYFIGYFWMKTVSKPTKRVLTIITSDFGTTVWISGTLGGGEGRIREGRRPWGQQSSQLNITKEPQGTARSLSDKRTQPRCKHLAERSSHCSGCRHPLLEYPGSGRGSTSHPGSYW